MSENVLPYPTAPRRAGPPGPTSSLVTYLTLLDGRVVHECHETLLPDLPVTWPEAYPTYDDPYDRFERGRLQPTPARNARRKLDLLAGFVGGEAALAALDDVPLVADGDPWVMATRPLSEADERIEELVGEVARSCFDAETTVALRRAVLLVLEGPFPRAAGWSAAVLVGAACWAIGHANGLFGAKKLTQREVLDALSLRNYLSEQGNAVARFLAGDHAARSEWGTRSDWSCSSFPDGFEFDRLTPVGRAELLLGDTRALILRLREQAESDLADAPDDRDTVGDQG
ncbi:hypothetical protein [Allobranchiibius sp. GilTou38]|uniref:hypothetical protein n=1 Tax=Allobranchiibius sp. GilTou38 TaxID=2815210 RepID=UPI001AA114A7|nr:hypothetical protein [Allobranchiibius sp. GilTou38]MBO1767350.1 hypothetical protein [Allobranchiibius sp. GilTou38]